MPSAQNIFGGERKNDMYLFWWVSSPYTPIDTQSIMETFPPMSIRLSILSKTNSERYEIRKGVAFLRNLSIIVHIPIIKNSA
jgi:hypothetical protein